MPQLDIEAFYYGSFGFLFGMENTSLRRKSGMESNVQAQLLLHTWPKLSINLVQRFLNLLSCWWCLVFCAWLLLILALSLLCFCACGLFSDSLIFRNDERLVRKDIWILSQLSVFVVLWASIFYGRCITIHRITVTITMDLVCWLTKYLIMKGK